MTCHERGCQATWADTYDVTLRKETRLKDCHKAHNAGRNSGSTAYVHVMSRPDGMNMLMKVSMPGI